MSSCVCGAPTRLPGRVCWWCNQAQTFRAVAVVQLYAATVDRCRVPDGPARAAVLVLAHHMAEGAEGALLLLVELGPVRARLDVVEQRLMAAATSLAAALWHTQRGEDVAAALDWAVWHLSAAATARWVLDGAR